MDNEVLQILEYKSYKEVDYFLVKWRDNSTSWSKARNLNCKDKIVEFIKKTIKIIEEKERQKAKETRDIEENEVLKRLMANNIKETAKAEAKNLEHIKNLINAKKPKNDSGYYNSETITKQPPRPINRGLAHESHITHPPNQDQTIPFKKTKPDIDIFRRATENVPTESPLKMSFDRIPIQDSLFKPKREIKNNNIIIKSNTINIKISETESLTIECFINEKIPPINLTLASGTLIGIDQIYSKLFANYFQYGGLDFFPSDDSKLSELSDFEVKMSAKKLVFLQQTLSIVWGIYVPSQNEDLIFIKNKPRFMIFKFKVDSYFESICKLKNFAQSSTHWVEKSYKISHHLLSDYLFKDFALPNTKKVFILGDFRSSKLLSTFVSNKGEVVNDIIHATTALVEKDKLPFLHLIPNFYNSLRSEIRYYLFESANFEEILPSGGIITFDDAFLKNADIMIIVEFIELILKKKNWGVKIKQASLDIVHKRMNAPSVDVGCLHRIKRMHQVFCDNICDPGNGDCLRDHLESIFHRIHRFFLEISTEKFGDGIVKIDEAYRLLTKY